MSTRMLIDAAHPEETRVAVVRSNRVEEFDFEAAAKKQLRGNIYLARVTRIEPSLQAAFVEYGGNRHGFLAFNEIHPDYYQIPVEDREQLLQEERDQAAAEKDDDDDANGGNGNNGNNGDDSVEEISADDSIDDAARARGKGPSRRYKIQEVIKRRQILLVQVVKEERGNKGAALTTYLSLAGRYCVLMPNTARGGGVSRKIADAKDRKRLKGILNDLDVPDGMGCIIRTAGASRTKTEVKRDYTYLLRLWENIRDLTLKSIAPTLIYEEGSLIKRAIRDIYTRDIEEILVEGEAGYRVAKDFMKMLMPSHASKVKSYKDRIPLFHRFQVEKELSNMYSTTVPLPAGGYLVINPTEALVSVDVNSGRSTRERNVEKTALKTNLEAAEELARQLRLRDLAGLIVVDFIDMDENRNNRSVERKLKDALKTDRARIQVGRISSFGLLEMSRQRTRPGVLEASTQVCPICEGAGIVRTTESSALQIMRLLEDEGIRGRRGLLRVTAPSDVAMYLLNDKRQDLNALEERFSFSIEIDSDPHMVRPHYSIEREGGGDEDEAGTVVTPDAFLTQEQAEAVLNEEQETEDEPKSRRSRGGNRRRPKKNEDADDSAEDKKEEPEAEAKDEDANKGESKSRRRRGKRGGRRRNKRPQNEEAAAEGQQAQDGGEAPDPGQNEAEQPQASGSDDDTAENAKKDNSSSDAAEPEAEEAKKAEPQESSEPDAEAEPAVAESAEDEQPADPAEKEEEKSLEPVGSDGPNETAEPREEEKKPSGPPKRGWWSR
ncbi:MAG: Rne/Rng family ribonuclease [Alphaproteobacteria bacterium]|nr:Rne/Rng family ribonuclease [Alphaproteobacteria bacterium]